MSTPSLRILVVDDDAVGRRVLARLLTREGHVVELHASGAEALESLRAARADALLTDFKMPRMGGLELVALARAIDPALRCLVMSGYVREDTIPDYITWVDKPIDIQRLAAVLAAGPGHET